MCQVLSCKFCFRLSAAFSPTGLICLFSEFKTFLSATTDGHLAVLRKCLGHIKTHIHINYIYIYRIFIYIYIYHDGCFPMFSIIFQHPTSSLSLGRTSLRRLFWVKVLNRVGFPDDFQRLVSKSRPICCVFRCFQNIFLWF